MITASPSTSLVSSPGWAPTAGVYGELTGKEGWSSWFAKNPYAEWYLNSIRIEGSPSHKHHLETYGKGFSYDDFAPLFNEAIGAWEPGEWAELFRQAIDLPPQERERFVERSTGSDAELAAQEARLTASGTLAAIRGDFAADTCGVVIDTFGEDGWLDWWSAVRDAGITVAESPADMGTAVQRAIAGKR